MFGYTFAYAPLEQILGSKETDTRATWTLSAPRYHLLTGYPPVNARDRSRPWRVGRQTRFPRGTWSVTTSRKTSAD